jgi:hypothetical protein
MNESSKVPAKFESIIINLSGVMNFQSRKLRKKTTLTHIHLIGKFQSQKSTTTHTDLKLKKKAKNG